MNSVNPFTGKELASFQELTIEEINQKLDLSKYIFQTYRTTDFVYRAKLMKKVASLLRSKKDYLAEIITSEMGKLITESKAEIDKCAWVCEYYAENAADFLKDELIESDAYRSYIVYEPIGTILAVMPWNFPFWQVFRFAAPTLMSGNIGVLKHSSNVSQCAIEIEQLFIEAGYSEGVFQSFLINSTKVEYLINHETIKAITLTGSEYAGSKVAQAAGKALKKTVLELGGSDPFIILDDADLKYAVDMAVKSRFQNCGQSCIAAKRFIVPKKLNGPFLALLMEKVENMKVGNPMDSTTQIGPMARFDLLEQLDKQVDESIARGAVLISGGAAFDPDKCLYTPTILADVVSGMPAYDEELFGPVAIVMNYENIEEAIQIANDTFYGLGASIWTKDVEKGEQVARKIEAGVVFVNEIVKSDPRLPFGGTKLSGYGRELSYLGIREFMNCKTVYIK